MESVLEENARLRLRVAELEASNQRLERRVEELLRAFEEAQRVGKRQAAPFSRRTPKPIPPSLGGKRGLDMSAAAAVRFPRRLIKHWRPNYRVVVRTAAAN